MTFWRNFLPNILLQGQNAVLVVKKTPQNFYQCTAVFSVHSLPFGIHCKIECFKSSQLFSHNIFYCMDHMFSHNIFYCMDCMFLQILSIFTCGKIYCDWKIDCIWNIQFSNGFQKEENGRGNHHLCEITI